MKLAHCTFLVALAACSSEPKPVPVPPPAPAPTPAIVPPPTAPTPTAPEGSLQSKESRQVAATLARVSELRTIKATKPVPGVKLERDQLVGRIKEKALREFPPEALRREGDLLKLFGFAPVDFDYLSEMLKLLDSQLEGFYEPNNGTMYLAADLKGVEAKVTLAHELVHALQDQRWDLKPRSTYKPGEGDKTLALACLAEGDATSLMIDYGMADEGKGTTALDLPDNLLRGSMAAGMESKSIEKVPHILKASLIAPYIDGLMFVNTARRRGGWQQVNKVWDQPPETSEQVLHYDKWEKHEPTLKVSAPTANALGAGWSKEDEDTFGELDFALTYEEWLDGPDARKAAAGWGGDRSSIYAKGDEIASAVHERYDDKIKGDLMQKIVGGITKKLGKPAMSQPTAACYERPDLGPLVVEWKDRELVIALGPAKRGATWTSTGKCATTKQWADEVLANP